MLIQLVKILFQLFIHCNAKFINYLIIYSPPHTKIFCFFYESTKNGIPFLKQIE